MDLVGTAKDGCSAATGTEPLTTKTESEEGGARAVREAGRSRRSLGITAKLAIMVVVPLVALGGILAVNITERLSTQRDLEALAVASALVSDVDGVIDGLQFERDCSSLYLSSNGALHCRELEKKWDETDAAIVEFEENLDRAGGVFTVTEPHRALKETDQVVSVRRQVLDQDLTWSESQVFYSELIGRFEASRDMLVQMVRDGNELSGILEGILNLSDAVEAASMERAIITKILAEGTIEGEVIEALSRLDSHRQFSVDEYREHVPLELRTRYEMQVALLEKGPVEMVRQRVQLGDLRADPLTWFTVSTGAIDALNTSQDELIDTFAATSASLANEARLSVWGFSGFGAFVFLASLWVSITVGRRLSSRAIELARVAEAIQQGSVRERVRVDTGDEFGRLGLAFNQMTDDLTTLNRTLEDQVENRTADLRASEALNRAMLEAIPDLIFRLSAEGVYIDFVALETSQEQRTFADQSLFVGKNMAEILPPKVADEFLGASLRARESGQVQQLEYEYQLDGEIREREARFVVVLGSQETMVLVRDITERKAQDRRLVNLIRSKDEFIASISHELRTPLTVLLGFAELLRDGDSGLAPAEAQEMITEIAGQATELSHIVEDLLVAARAEIDTLNVSHIPVDLRAQLMQVLDTLHKVRLDEISIDGEPLTVMGDPMRIRQILRNLFTNAVRYGGDSVEVHMRTDGANAIIQVRDDGPGVPMAEREAIFEPYHQVNTASGMPGSVGLGLTVSRSLARIMGGDIAYRYEDGISIFEGTFVASEFTGRT